MLYSNLLYKIFENCNKYGRDPMNSNFLLVSRNIREEYLLYLSNIKYLGMCEGPLKKFELFENLVELDIESFEFEDSDLLEINKLKTLKSITLCNSNINDKQICLLDNLTGLEYLDLDGCQNIKNDGFEFICENFTDLFYLNINGINVSCNDIKDIVFFINLEILEIGNISDPIFIKYISKLENLQKLIISIDSDIDSKQNMMEYIKYLGEFKNIQEIIIYYSKNNEYTTLKDLQITENITKNLIKNKTLKKLKLNYFDLCINNIYHLINKNLLDLKFNYCWWLDRQEMWSYINENLDDIKNMHLEIHDRLMFCSDDDLDIIDEIMKNKENLTINIDENESHSFQFTQDI